MNAELRRLCEQEPDLAAAREFIDVTADIYNQQYLDISVTFRNNEIWKKRLPITRSQIEMSSEMSDKALEDQVTTTMRKHLDLVAQMHFARLEQMFPKSIDTVTMGYDPAKDQKLVIVKFKNGHVAQGPESEAKTDVFHARCAMLYDLPPI